MADKQYTLNFKMYDGTTQSVNFTVPQGDAGPKGEKGDPGEKGIQGMKGDPGADGYTPVKGTDYFTEADIEDIAFRAAKFVETDIKTDETLCFDEDGVLGVNITNDAEADNTLPITSAGVHTLMGNIADAWVKLADITATEDVNQFYFTTDGDGDAFSCKRVVAYLEIASASDLAVYMSINHNSIWGNSFGNNILEPSNNTSTQYLSCEVELIGSNFAKMRMSYNGTSDSFYQDKENAMLVRELNAEYSDIHSLIIANSGAGLFGAGTRIRVWGLK